MGKTVETFPNMTRTTNYYLIVTDVSIFAYNSNLYIILVNLSQLINKCFYFMKYIKFHSFSPWEGSLSNTYLPLNVSLLLLPPTTQINSLSSLKKIIWIAPHTIRIIQCTTGCFFRPNCMVLMMHSENPYNGK